VNWPCIPTVATITFVVRFWREWSRASFRRGDKNENPGDPLAADGRYRALQQVHAHARRFAKEVELEMKRTNPGTHAWTPESWLSTARTGRKRRRKVIRLK
jgi:hypothetical protein